jgi:hypothetical protein
MEAYEGTTNKSYVWATLAELLKNFCQIEIINEKNKTKLFKLNDQGFILTSQEYASLRANEVETLFKCFCEAKVKIAIRGLSKFQQLLCYEDQKYIFCFFFEKKPFD